MILCYWNCLQAYIDRTPFYEGDALSEVVKIKGTDGELDHKSLPSFVRVTTKKPTEKITYTQRNETQKESITKNSNRNVSLSAETDDKEIEGRDIGAMVSMLTRAVQQLKSIVDEQQEQLLEVMDIVEGIIDKGPDKEQPIIPRQGLILRAYRKPRLD